LWNCAKLLEPKQFSIVVRTIMLASVV
jgi:hypothetical protein